MARVGKEGMLPGVFVRGTINSEVPPGCSEKLLEYLLVDGGFVPSLSVIFLPMPCLSVIFLPTPVPTPML